MIVTFKHQKVTNAHDIGSTHKHLQLKTKHQQLFETSVNPVHNAPIELPPARSFPACPPPHVGIFFFVMGFLTAVGSA
jgi:hypothetical protein